MPSNKDPVEVVQPGPGRLPDGTVSATALTFPIGAGSNAALQAHITDPYGAHAATAISNAPLGGSGPRASSAIEVQTSLNDVYAALNSQAVWVLDVAGSAANSDYFGSSALVSAMTQIALNGKRKILFLRPGVYTWDDSRVFTGVTIIGDAVGVVEIRNTLTGMRIGSDVTFKNVFINLNTTLVFQDSGHSLLQNVDLDVNGVVSVASPYNSFQQCQRSSGGSPLYLDVTDAHNSFTQVTASQLSDSSSVGGNSYRDIVLDSTPKDSTTNVLFVSASHSTFTGVMIAPTGSFTASIVKVPGPFNSIRDLKIGPITSTTLAVVEIAGDNNNLDFVRISNVAASNSGLTLSGNHNALSNIRLNLVVSTAQNVLVSGDNNRWDGLETFFVTSSSNTLSSDSTSSLNEFRNISLTSPTASNFVMNCEGTSNVYDTVSITSVSALTCSVLMWVVGGRNVFRDVTLTSVNATSSLLNILSNGTIVDGLTINTGTVSGPTAHPIWVSGSIATNTRMSNVVLNSVSGTTGLSTIVYLDAPSQASDITIENIRFFGCSGANQLLHTAPRSTISGVEVRSSFTGVNGDGMIEVGTDCVVSDIFFDQMSGVNIPLVKVNGTRPTVRNIRLGSTLTSAFGGAFGFCLVSVGGTGAVVDGVTVANLATLPSSALFSYSQGPVGSLVKNVVLDTIGGTTAPTAIMTIPTSSLCTRNTLQNWTLTTVRMNSTAMFSFDTPYVDGLVLDNISISGTSFVPTIPPLTAVFYFNFTRSSNTIRHGTTVKNCYVSSSDTVYNHVALTAGSTINPINVVGCDFQVVSTTPCISLSSCSRVSFLDCTVTSPKAFAADNAGVSLTNSVFKSTFVSGATGVQLFSGWGRISTSVVPAEPLVIRNCTFLTSTCNNTTLSTSQPNVFFGGDTTSAASNHGAVIVDGLRIGRNPTESFSFWQRSPILTIDTASQSPMVESSFKNITIDLEGAAISFTGSASGSAVFADTSTTYSGAGAVVEIHGPSTQLVSSVTKIDGLNLLRLPRNAGAGGRAALLARGVALTNLVVDAALGTAGNWGNPAVALNNCTLTDADFWATTSLPLDTDSGSTVAPLFAENDSRCQRVRMRNFAVQPAEQGACVRLLDSSLCDSFIHMQAGSHIPIPGAMVLVNGSGTAQSWVANNKITYLHYAASSGDPRRVIGCSCDGAHIMNNIITNLAASSASTYSGTPASSNGGGCWIDNSADNVTISNNVLTYQWETNTTIISAISSNGEHCKILGNFVTNTATAAHATAGGTTRIEVTAGLYSNVSNNTVNGSNTGSRVLIDTSGGGSGIVIGNQVDNLASLGVINLSGSDKPTPASTYNILS